MALPATKLVIGGRPPRFAKNGYTKFDVPSGIVGFWLFNRPPGATDDEAIAIGKRNRVKGAANADTDNEFPFGNLPTVHDDFWTFNQNGPLLTSLSQVANMTVLALCRVPTANKGSLGGAGNLAHVVGSFGNAADYGFNIEYSSATAVRGVTYHEPGGVLTAATNQCTATSGTHDRWRLLRLNVGSSLELDNITADGTSNNPTPTPLTSPRLGTQRISIGARISSGTLPYTIPVDIAMIMIVSSIWSAPTETTMLAQARRQISLMPSITEGSV